MFFFGIFINFLESKMKSEIKYKEDNKKKDVLYLKVIEFCREKNMDRISNVVRENFFLQ